MGLLTMPEGAIFTRRAWIPPNQNQVNKSRWTGARKKLRLPGAGVWRVSANVLPMATEAQSWPWKAFITALEGEANTFLMPFACKQTLELNPSVGNGAVQGATTAPIVGMAPNGVFLRGGQALTFLHPSGKRQLVLLTLDLVADNVGAGVATFRGALREAPTAGTIVEARNPVCEMEMTSGDVGWSEDEGKYTVAFDAEESF